MIRLPRIVPTNAPLSSLDARVQWLRQGLAMARGRALGALEALGSPLTPPVLAEAVETTIAVESELPHVVESARHLLSTGTRPIGRVALVLAGNVETALVRPLVWSLVLGNAVAVRASSRRPGLAPLVVQALLDAARPLDDGLGGSLATVAFTRDDDAAWQRLAAWSDVMHVYGSDATVRALGHALSCDVIGHGHGTSIAVLSRPAMIRLGDVRGPAARRALAGLARDVARYDQRGCLSPQVVLVEEGDGAWSGLDVARVLHEELTVLDRTFPRGALTNDELAAIARYRDVAAAIGDLFATETHGVAFDGHGDVRSSPNGRHVGVLLRDSVGVDTVVESLGHHLKCLGVLDDDDVRAARLRWRTLRADVTPVGRMQTPSWSAPADGRPPWDGMLRRG